MKIMERTKRKRWEKKNFGMELQVTMEEEETNFGRHDDGGGYLRREEDFFFNVHDNT
ncbi:unnamed protein product [Arabidopsis halleri]